MNQTLVQTDSLVSPASGGFRSTGPQSMEMSTSLPCNPSIVPKLVALNELTLRSLEIDGLEKDIGDSF